VANLQWSPKGNFITYTSDVKMKDGVSDLYPQYPKADVRIYDSLPVRHWDEWEDNLYNHLFISFADGSRSLDLTPDAMYDIPMKPYGGREEIVDAVKKLIIDYDNNVIDIENLNEKILASYLYNPELPDIDLLIRTSGEKRISNFMLWKLAYAELYFTDTLWPDFTTVEFEKAN